MFDYFIRKYDMHWFDNPQRPAPPIYKRPCGSRSEPVTDSPIGYIGADCEMVRLTDEQLAVWRAA